VDLRFVKPLDEDLIRKIALEHELVVTVEENSVMAGAGSAINEFLSADGISIPMLNLGIPDTFISHDSPENMLESCGLDQKGMLASIRMRLNDTDNAVKSIKG
jgi:1-deoxy-D-xylulose-5-phosphate synthase